MTLAAYFQELFDKNPDPFTDIIGMSNTKYQLKSALMTNRHILIFGPPGIGKTTFAKNVAKLLPEFEGKKGVDRFVRVQGSPDLTVEDLIGDIDPQKALEFGPLSKEAFVPGKIFQANRGVLFFDEVNRCSEKLQNALLQALEEGVATIGSYDVDLPAEFLFIGTLNPQDSSTEKLSDAFLDRFDIVHMGYPDSLEDEYKIVTTYGEKLDVSFPEKLLRATVSYVRELRNPKKVKKMPGVRASLGLYERAQANALLNGRDTVVLLDVRHAVDSVLAHRLELKPSIQYTKSPQDYIGETFESHFADIEDSDSQGDST